MCIVMSLKGIFDNLREYKSTSTKKEKLWCEFHHKRLSILPDIWKHFYRGLDFLYNQLVVQTFNLKLFVSQLTAFFANDSVPKDNNNSNNST